MGNDTAHGGADSWQSWAAGVLPVAWHPGAPGWPGEPVVLLGRDAPSKGGTWSDFAGGGEAGDESPVHTALRELAEETGGALTLAPRDLDGALVFTGTTPSGKVLHRYVVRVDYDPTLPRRFTGSKGGEKRGLAWFPLRALPPLRRVFLLQMRQDQRDIERFVTDGRVTAGSPTPGPTGPTPGPLGPPRSLGPPRPPGPHGPLGPHGPTQTTTRT